MIISRPYKFIFITIFSILIVPYHAFCQSSTSSTDFALKVSVEASLENRLKSVLADIVGGENVAVIVNAELENGSGKKSERVEQSILPGVPLKKEFSTGMGSGMLTPDIQSKIRKLNVTILIDRRINETLKNTVRDISTSVIGFDQGRGDRLDLREMSLGRSNFDWLSIFYPPQVYWLILVVLGSAFLLIATTFIINNPFKRLAAEFLKNVNWEFFQQLRAPQPAASIEMPVYSDKSSPLDRPSDGDSSMPFSFISEKYLADLVYMLKDEPAKNISIILTYLNNELTTKLLEQFPSERQVEIAFTLSNLDEVDPGEVTRLEEKVRNQLRYKVGGENKVATLLGISNDEVRDKVLQMIKENNIETATRLKEKVKSFEEVMVSIPPSGIQSIYRQLDHTLFAQILKGSNEDIRNRVLVSLTEGAAARLMEEMELSPPLSEKRLRIEKHKLVQIIRSMSLAGLLEEEAV